VDGSEPVAPTGEQLEIAAAGYVAVVTEVGAGLRTLTHAGRDLVAGFAADRVRPVYRGALLAPWPNRVADGRYSFGGGEHQLALNEVPRRNAIHGLVDAVAWRLVGRDPDALVLAHRIWPNAGYPFCLDLEVRYGVDGAGLTTELTCRNAGSDPAPYGCAPHTYLVAGDGTVDEWHLDLPATQRLEVDPERLLPADDPVLQPSAPPTSLRGVALDDAFTGLVPDDDGRAVVRLTADDGRGVEMSWDSTVLPWVQVHTADRPEPDLNRAGLAVEPMTCPPDAFRSGTDLVVLAPGEAHRATWTVAALARG